MLKADRHIDQLLNKSKFGGFQKSYKHISGFNLNALMYFAKKNKHTNKQKSKKPFFTLKHFTLS